MIEITTIITLSIILYLISRRTKPRQLERPVVVERAGNYRVTLAPKLNLAISFIEHIASGYRAHPHSSGDSPTMHLDVNDPGLKQYGVQDYLLAVTLRQGMLHFQAMLPVTDSGSLRQQLDEFARQALQGQPSAGTIETGEVQRIMDAVKQAAASHGIGILQLQE